MLAQVSQQCRLRLVIVHSLTRRSSLVAGRDGNSSLFSSSIPPCVRGPRARLCTRSRWFLAAGLAGQSMQFVVRLHMHVRHAVAWQMCHVIPRQIGKRARGPKESRATATSRGGSHEAHSSAAWTHLFWHCINSVNFWTRMENGKYNATQ